MMRANGEWDVVNRRTAIRHSLRAFGNRSAVSEKE